MFYFGCVYPETHGDMRESPRHAAAGGKPCGELGKSLLTLHADIPRLLAAFQIVRETWSVDLFGDVYDPI